MTIPYQKLTLIMEKQSHKHIFETLFPNFEPRKPTNFHKKRFKKLTAYCTFYTINAISVSHKSPSDILQRHSPPRILHFLQFTARNM
jgi:hypothetical protein